MPADPSRAVFLSYASQDAEAARRICDALRVAGVEVWFDQSELVGGDAWDQKIRRQIKDCALFVPVISANTQARREGYFRLEWRLAVERMQQMDDDLPFLVPIVIDGTRDAEAFVPERFRAVQWTRLAGGEAGAGFCARVRQLLNGTGGTRPAASSDAGQPAALPAKPLRRWLVPSAMALAAVVALALWRFGVFMPKPASVDAKASPIAAAAPASEVSGLLAQMWQIYEKNNDASREDWALAEELGARAVKLENNNADAWAAYSMMTITAWYAGFDVTDTHYNDGMKRAERAMTLAPKSIEAQFAFSNCLRMKVATRAEGERMLRDLVQRAPTDKRILRTMAAVLRMQEKWDESLAMIDRALALPGDKLAAQFGKSAILLFAGRHAEADEVNEQILRERPSPFAYLMKAYYQVYLHDDLEQGRQAIEKVPPLYLLRDEGAFIASRIWLWRGDYDRCVAALSGATEDFLQNRITGANAVSSELRQFARGLAHHSAGRAAAAQVDWRAGLQAIEKRLAVEAGRPDLLYWKARLLANLGERAEAERTLEAFRQLAEVNAETKFAASLVLISLARLDEAIAVLREALPDRNTSPMARDFWRIMLRHDPSLAPLRSRPEFAELMALIGAPGNANSAASTKTDPRSVAVLAFTNLGDDKDSEYFGEGISEELLNVLAKVPGLTVKARTSSFSARLKHASAQEIGEALKVGHIVNGTLSRSGNSVRVIAHLSRTDTGDQVWTDRFEAELDKPWALQDRIAGRIAQELRLKLDEHGRAEKTVNPEAYRLVLEARHFWNLRTMDDFARAEEAYAKAVAIDPQFAVAHAGRADNFQIRAQYRMLDGLGGEADDQERARREVEVALSLEPALPEALVAQAYLVHNQGRLADAAAIYDQVFALNPNHAYAHLWHSQWLDATGHFDQALAESRLATELDPLGFMIVDRYSHHLAYAGRFAEALTSAERAATLRPDSFMPNLGVRATLLLSLDRKTEAIDLARSVRHTLTKWPRWNADADALAVLEECGLAEEAKAYAAELLEMLPSASYVRGFVLAHLGRFDEAVPFLLRAPVIQRRSYFYDRFWDRWRGDPRFLQFIEKLGAAAEYRSARETLTRVRAQSRSDAIHAR